MLPLSWHNRDQDLTCVALAPLPAAGAGGGLSYGEPDAPNMLVEGDNLDAFEGAAAVLRGQVKCVFIDPPYNTGSAFEHYDDNIEHLTWLPMMYHGWSC